MDAVLHTERLLVRLWTLEDADDCYSIYTDPDLPKHMPGVAPPGTAPSRAWLEQRIAGKDSSPGLGFWALVEKDTGRIIGGAMLDESAEPGPAARMGFHLSAEAKGKGYAEEVAHALIRYGFDELQLERIVGVVLPDDLVSQRVLEKVGMAEEGESSVGDTHVQVMTIHRALHPDQPE